MKSFFQEALSWIGRFNPHPPRRAGEINIYSRIGRLSDVSIRTRPGGQVKYALASEILIELSFNPHPPRRAGEMRF